MSFTLRSALLATVLLSAPAMATGLPTAQAAGTEFSFTSGNPAPEVFGNSYSQTVDGLTTTATAWSTAGRRNRYETAELEIYNGFGMGVCNRNEGINCSSSGNMHALDNKGSTDLVLFSFSSAVKLTNLSLRQYGGDSNLSLWAGTGSLNLAGLKPASLGPETLALNTSAVNNIKAVDLSTFVGTYDWLAVSARQSDKNDFAKLTGLNVQAATVPVPEADTWAMLLAGLGLVGFAVRRRT